jgi:hypothetical protein
MHNFALPIGPQAPGSTVLSAKQMPLWFGACRLAITIAASLLASACSKEPAPSPTPSTPLVEQRAADPLQKPTEEFRGSFAPGGIAATYRARFSEGKIQSLEETRKASAQTGTYEFLGARLMKYHGAALNSNDMIELEFDEQGKVRKARAGDNDVSAEEITAIRDRAQSLRSHAVSQYAVKGHDQV